MILTRRYANAMRGPLCLTEWILIMITCPLTIRIHSLRMNWRPTMTNFITWKSMTHLMVCMMTPVWVHTWLMKWHLRRTGLQLTTSLTCFKQQTPLSTPTNQRIRLHLYTGLQHPSAAPWTSPGKGGLGCSGCFVVVQFHHSPFTPITTPYSHASFALNLPHTHAGIALGAEPAARSAAGSAAKCYAITASPLPLLKSRGIEQTRGCF